MKYSSTNKASHSIFISSFTILSPLYFRSTWLQLAFLHLIWSYENLCCICALLCCTFISTPSSLVSNHNISIQLISSTQPPTNIELSRDCVMPKQLGFQKGMNSSVGYSTVQQLCCGFFSFLGTLPGFWELFWVFSHWGSISRLRSSLVLVFF
jgi:hypothetical protein